MLKRLWRWLRPAPYVYVTLEEEKDDAPLFPDDRLPEGRSDAAREEILAGLNLNPDGNLRLQDAITHLLDRVKRLEAQVAVLKALRDAS